VNDDLVVSLLLCSLLLLFHKPQGPSRSSPKQQQSSEILISIKRSDCSLLAYTSLERSRASPVSLIMEPPAASPSNRFCAYTFKCEADLPNGQKLLTCERCKETNYISTEAQTSHWNAAHRFVCKRIHEELDDLDAVKDAPIEKCFEDIDYLVKHPEDIKGRLLLRLLQRVLDYLLHFKPRFYDDKEILADNIGNFILGPLNHKFSRDESPDAQNRFIELMWAIPGFTNFFLSEDIMLSPIMKRLKEQGKPPPPKPQIVDGAIVPGTGYHPAFQLPTPYTNFIMHFYQFSAVYVKIEGNDLSESKARQTQLSGAICRQSMKLWMCEYARASITTPSFESNQPELWSCRTRYLTDIVKCFVQKESPEESYLYGDPDEFLPGMKFKDLIQVMMEDDLFLFGNPQSRIQYHLCQHSKNEKILSPLERLELLDKLYDWNPPDELFPNMYIQTEEYAVSIKDGFYLIILGRSTANLLKMYDIVIHPENLGRFKPEVVKRVRERRAYLLESVLPTVRTCCSASYQKSSKPIPEDVLFLIADFLMPENHITTGLVG
jgi:hypothetical protein